MEVLFSFVVDQQRYVRLGKIHQVNTIPKYDSLATGPRAHRTLM